MHDVISLHFVTNCGFNPCKSFVVWVLVVGRRDSPFPFRCLEIERCGLLSVALRKERSLRSAPFDSAPPADGQGKCIFQELSSLPHSHCKGKFPILGYWGDMAAHSMRNLNPMSLK